MSQLELEHKVLFLANVVTPAGTEERKFADKDRIRLILWLIKSISTVRCRSKGCTKWIGPPIKFNIYSFDDRLVFLLFYLCYNQYLLSYFYFLSFFNYYLKNGISVVHLMLKDFLSSIFIYLFTLIFCYFTGRISHHSLNIILNKKSVFIHMKEARLGDLVRNSCSKSVYIAMPVKVSCYC